MVLTAMEPMPANIVEIWPPMLDTRDDKLKITAATPLKSHKGIQSLTAQQAVH